MNYLVFWFKPKIANLQISVSLTAQCYVETGNQNKAVARLAVRKLCLFSISKGQQGPAAVFFIFLYLGMDSFKLTD